MTDTTEASGQPEAAVNPIYAGLVGGFDAVVTRAAALKAKRDAASKSTQTTWLDALNKSTDSQVVDLRNDMNEHLNAVNGYTDSEGVRHPGIRDALKVRLVEINELSADAAQLDTLKEQFSEARTQVRAMYDALVGKANIIPESETAIRASIESKARPVLGQDRGRKAEESE
jgi:CRISPR/Cas system CSM-associated protein Csm2 small subunit